MITVTSDGSVMLVHPVIYFKSGGCESVLTLTNKLAIMLGNTTYLNLALGSYSILFCIEKNETKFVLIYFNGRTYVSFNLLTPIRTIREEICVRISKAYRMGNRELANKLCKISNLLYLLQR